MTYWASGPSAKTWLEPGLVCLVPKEGTRPQGSLAPTIRGGHIWDNKGTFGQTTPPPPPTLWGRRVCSQLTWLIPDPPGAQQAAPQLDSPAQRHPAWAAASK